MTKKIRVPVLSPSGEPLMPTTSARARKWIAAGKAKTVWNDLKVFCVQLLQKPSGTETQKIVVAIDPGKLWSGCAAISQKAVLFTANLILPFTRVKLRKQAQKILRRARRGRRINRSLPFKLRAHRQKRFDNRRGNKLPPSIRASKQLELRIIKELTKLFPLTEIVYEYVKADVDLTSGRKKARSGKGFSPVMVGQKYMLQWLGEIAPTYKLEGWQTSVIRKQLGLPKNKNKSSQDVSAHANDAIAAAASRFIEYKSFQTRYSRGHRWVGSIESLGAHSQGVRVTSPTGEETSPRSDRSLGQHQKGECNSPRSDRSSKAPFRVISRPQLYRRQLHFENPTNKGVRKRKGGTVTPFGFRSGDYVKAIKAGETYQGWVGGYTNNKTKAVSIYDANWKRIGQFSLKKTELLKRGCGLCVT